MSLEFDSDLNDSKRKVQSVLTFTPGALPVPGGDDGGPGLAFRMSLHRDLLCGRGFYHTLAPHFPKDAGPLSAEAAFPKENTSVAASGANEDANLDGQFESSTSEFSWPDSGLLPAVNFLDIPDQSLADAVVREALPEDVNRFRAYLSDRPLGLGLIVAPVGEP